MSRRRSRRSYVVEILLTVALVAGIYRWLTNGGPEWVGSYLAGETVTTSRPSGDNTPNEGDGEPEPTP
jgi:hypothetical protein